MLLHLFNWHLAGLLWLGLFVNFFPPRRQNETPNPVKWSLKPAPAAKSYRKQFTAQVTAQIAEGWHLYSLEEVPNGPRPTQITLPEGQPFTLSGEIEQPLPITKFDENFGIETQFYEERATFLLPIKISSTAQPGAAKLIIQTRYQTCNEHLCLPPKTQRLETRIKIK